MINKSVINIGILGLGVVGQGVCKHFENNFIKLNKRLGVKLNITHVAARDIKKTRAISLDNYIVTDNPESIVINPEIDIICELVGGTSFAKDLTLKALKSGKIVVTANKALICEHGEELFAVAKESGSHYLFEASVAGGIPIIKVLRESLVANQFKLIYGVLNGTCNYILTQMQRKQESYDVIVNDARKLGYVESDESLDLDGWDTAHKAVILAYLAHGKWISLKDIAVEGIRNVSLKDIQWADDLGYKIKLLAQISRDFEKNTLYVSVHPTLIEKNNILANVDDVFNGVCLNGDIVGDSTHIGRGAGQDPTASAVISDICDAVNLIINKSNQLNNIPDNVDTGTNLNIASPGDITGCYYLRLNVNDKPGVLAETAHILAEFNISIASVIQCPVLNDQSANLILTTHPTNEKCIQNTVGKLTDSEWVLNPPFLLHIANFNN